MDETEFVKLPLMAKAECVFEYGDFVNTILHNGLRTHLFTLEGTYIEIAYHIELNEIEYIEVLHNENNRLNLYIKGISIDALLNL